MLNRDASLQEWLDFIAVSHPSEIELGLERVQNVWRRIQQELDTTNIAARTVIVAGTNGKGSTAFSLANLLQHQGFRVGVYSSPHILTYNERVQVNGVPLDDGAIIEGFRLVESLRQDVNLTYFEFGTLAAFCSLGGCELDVAILEVGLGGRLDAVNVIDADISIITSIGLDHVDWLGDDLEAIASEKAGVLRTGQIALLGESLPRNVRAKAEQLNCQIYEVGEELGVSDAALTVRSQLFEREKPFSIPLPRTNLPSNNICLATQAFLLLTESLRPRADISHQELVHAVERLGVLVLPGRLEQIAVRPEVRVDVCHNPHAAEFVAERVNQMKASCSQVLAVYSSLEDKDIRGVVEAFGDSFKTWFIAPMNVPRAASKDRLETEVGKRVRDVLSFSCLEEAMSASLEVCSEDGLIIVFGSFHVVEAAKVYFAGEINRAIADRN